MNKTFIATAIALAVATLSPAANAADGEISFQGEVIGVTCTINGAGAGKDFTVTLPTVSASTLAAAGSAAGRTAFAIQVSDCNPGTGKVSTFFEAGSSVNIETGRLVVDRAGSNLEIALLNDTQGKIKVGAVDQNSQKIDLDSGAATLNYYAQYESLGDATVGEVASRVQYTMAYE